MSRVQIDLLPQAISDLEAIKEPLFSKVVVKIRLLKEFPSLGPALYGPLTGYRALTVDLFRIVYRAVSDDLLEIAYIRHCKRRMPA